MVSKSYITKASLYRNNFMKNHLWLLIVPALLIRGFTIVYPIIVNIYYSFLDYRVVLQIKEWGGIKNYKTLFTNAASIATFEFTIIFVISTVLSIVILGVLLGLLLNVKFWGKPYLRAITLIPWAMPTIVIGIAMMWGFNETYGFVNDLISRITQHPFTYNWLSKTEGARAAVILVEVWKNAPFYAIMVLSALQNIPDELYEAARVDGAGRTRCFVHITLPGVSRTMITMGIFFTLWRIASFDLVYAMTAGGPGTSTTLISYKIFLEYMKSLNFGYASAIAVFLFSIMVIIASTGMAFLRRIDIEK